MPYQPPRSVEELLRRYAEGERDFSDVELYSRNDEGSYPDLSGAHLDGIIFRRSYLTALFCNASLKNAVFDCNVKGSDFSRADLRDASFVGCAVDGIIFDDANLKGANFVGAFYHGHETDQDFGLQMQSLPRD